MFLMVDWVDTSLHSPPLSPPHHDPCVPGHGKIIYLIRPKEILDHFLSH